MAKTAAPIKLGPVWADDVKKVRLLMQEAAKWPFLKERQYGNGDVYGVNGSDIHDRQCPSCQGGETGLPLERANG
jgi:hypothetical protein